MAISDSNQEHHRIVISTDDARGGVTGHNVVYVLGYGLAGVIAAFAGVAIYQSYDHISDKISAAFAVGPLGFLQSISEYAAIVIVAAVAAGLVLSLWSSIAGRSDDSSQNFMRWRVAGQFAVIGALFAMTYV